MNKEACCEQTCGASPPPKGKWLTVAIWLLVFTILYNVVEGIVSVWFGNEAESIALFGFGLDSFIEVSAAGLMLWRLVQEWRDADPERLEVTGKTVHRYVGGTFLALAAYIGYESVHKLWTQELPSPTLIGIVIAALSAIIMPCLAWGKLKAANAIGSAALRAEAKETVACSGLSYILLVGLALNALFGWWWADPVAGLGMIPWLVKEGLEGLKGESCCGGE